MYTHRQEYTTKLSLAIEYNLKLEILGVEGANLVSFIGKGMNKRAQENLFSLLYQLLSLMDHLDFLVVIRKCTVQLKYILNHHKNTSTIFQHMRKVLLFFFQPNEGKNGIVAARKTGMKILRYYKVISMSKEQIHLSVPFPYLRPRGA